VWEQVEVALSSKGRLRILRALAKSPEPPTKYALERGTGLTPVELRRQLRLLVKLGWVEELPSSPKKYRVNVKEEFVRRQAELLSEAR